jgi:hypothetical protein
MEHHRGVGHARCYLVGSYTDANQWHGVCEVVDELASDSKAERHHKDIAPGSGTIRPALATAPAGAEFSGHKVVGRQLVAVATAAWREDGPSHAL